MSIKIDLPKAIIAKALEREIATLKRNNATEINPGMKQLRDKDIADITTAMNTMTETK